MSRKLERFAIGWLHSDASANPLYGFDLQRARRGHVKVTFSFKCNLHQKSQRKWEFAILNKKSPASPNRPKEVCRALHCLARSSRAGADWLPGVTADPPGHARRLTALGPQAHRLGDRSQRYRLVP